MEIRQLEMLSAVVEKRGYAGAGEHMHISHSAIHRQIRLLEEELGHKIFIRTGKNMQLTEAGKLLLAFASKVKQEARIVEQQIRDMQTLKGGALRLGTGTTTLILFLPAIMEEFRATYPGVELQIITGTADQLLRELQAGNLDLGLVSEPPEGWPAEKNLHYEHLYEEEYSFAVSKKHALAKETSIAWTDLKGIPIIAFPRSSRIRRLIDRFFAEAGVVPKIIMELENDEAIEKMINISLGAGFIAKRRISPSRLHCLRVGDKKVLLSIGAVRNESYVPRRAEEFLRICRSHASTRT